MDSLASKHCQVCEGGVAALNKEQAAEMLSQVPGWELNDKGDELSRTFPFKNYYHTMAFVNAVAWIAHQEDHHPDLEVYYNKCHVRYSTHAIKGLSQNDFICAAKINQLISSP